MYNECQQGAATDQRNSNHMLAQQVFLPFYSVHGSYVSITRGNSSSWLFGEFTSGLFSAVSMAKPGPNPVKDLTLVEVGSGRLH